MFVRENKASIPSYNQLAAFRDYKACWLRRKEITSFTYSKAMIGSFRYQFHNHKCY